MLKPRAHWTPHNTALQADERRELVTVVRELALAPLAAERPAVSRTPRMVDSPPERDFAPMI
jgi:hypothetical protein